MGFQGVRSIWGDEYKFLDEVLKSTAQALFKVRIPENGGIEFPDQTRLSEQEARFIFCHELQKKDHRFALEQPTTHKYRWADEDWSNQGTDAMGQGNRARLDVAVFHQKPTTEQRVLVNIEFKAGLPTKDSIAKDLVKLVREEAKGVWFLALPLDMSTNTPKKLFSLKNGLNGAIARVNERVAHVKSNPILIYIVDPATGDWFAKVLDQEIWKNPEVLFRTESGAPFYEAW
jgi:hypothetical protein